MKASNPSSAELPLKPGDLIKEREYAEIIGVALSTLRNWRATKSPHAPRFYKFGHCVRYLRPKVVDGEVIPS